MSNAVATIRRELTPAQLQLVQRTYAKDCTPDEFSLFVAVAQRAGLDPFRRQITAVVHNKHNPDKRQLTIITTIDGFRAIAARQGDYRPMDAPPVIELDDTLKSDTNPLGLIRAEVRVWKRFGDQWHAIVGEAYWDEFAATRDEWIHGSKTGRRILNDTWANMPRLMLAKTAEAQALRRGWPDDIAGLHAEEEMDRLRVIDATATEIVEQRAETQRQAKLGGSEAVMFVTAIGEPLERVERGAVADFLFSYVRNVSSADELDWFRRANAESLRQFWAWAPGDALEVKKFMEQRAASFAEA
jgi:phage recombination protein Bet